MYLLFLYLLLCCTILQVLPENTEVEFIPTAAVVEEEEIEELTVKSQNMIIQERQNLAKKYADKQFFTSYNLNSSCNNLFR